MAKLIKRFYVSGGSSRKSKGTQEPRWLKNISNKSTWYNDNDAVFYYNIVNNEDMYIQYGENVPGWASVRFFAQYLRILNETENSDGSIDCDVEYQALFFRGRKTDHSVAGFDVVYTIKIDGKTQYQFSGNTYADFDKGAQPKQRATTKIMPQEESKQFTLEVKIEYPNGESSTQTLNVGFGLYNPNPKTYIPMATRKSGKWMDLNSHNGIIKRRIDGNWVDKSKENMDSAKEINKGKNRIRKSGNWRQLPKMKGGSAL